MWCEVVLLTRLKAFIRRHVRMSLARSTTGRIGCHCFGQMRQANQIWRRKCYSRYSPLLTCQSQWSRIRSCCQGTYEQAALKRKKFKPLGPLKRLPLARQAASEPVRWENDENRQDYECLANFHDSIPRILGDLGICSVFVAWCSRVVSGPSGIVIVFDPHISFGGVAHSAFSCRFLLLRLNVGAGNLGISVATSQHAIYFEHRTCWRIDCKASLDLDAN